jgi:DNA-binding transcriptional ArsR family regulator
MLADGDLAAVGRALGDTHRARFVLALLGGEELPAGELASRAAISSSLASAHLAKLLESGLLSARKEGRKRYYRLAGPEIAQAVESLLTVAPQAAANGLTEVTRGKALRRARTCYDHLAGQLGVALADAFEREKVVTPAESGWALTRHGQRRLVLLGLDAEMIERGTLNHGPLNHGPLNHGRRPLLRPCQDWTERRPHMAGALGKALASRLLELDWVRRAPSSRALLITPLGERQLLAEFAVRV